MPTYEPKKIITETENNLVEYTFTDGEGNIVTAQVTPEVLEVLNDEKRIIKNQEQEYYRHGSSMDVNSPMVENTFAFTKVTIEDEVFQSIALLEIYKILDDHCTETQSKRFVFHRIYEYSLTEIAKKENCSPSRIKKSVEAAEIKIKKFLK